LNAPSPAPGSTIVAVATGPARGGIGVVRLSGPAALSVGRALAPGLTEPAEPRRAVFTPLLDARGQVVDEGLALYFRAPHSYTGEDVVELHAHGSPRVLSLLVEAALAREHTRHAEAGEFTRRAFLNGRIDLTRAEAVAELVASESLAQVQSAAAQLKGGLAAAVHAVKEPLLALGADLEALLDFPDEAEGAEEGLAPRLAAARAEVEALISRCQQGALIRRGAQVVLFGPANAGKSTLFNRLVGEARALVDDAPGTTRDALFARVEWDGLAITLVDTAGLGEPRERVEALGIARTRDAVHSADLAVLLLPPESGEADRAALRAQAGPETPVVEVRGKSDILVNKNNDLHVSGQTGEGVERLRSEVVARLSAGAQQAVALGGARHRDALVRAGQALERAASALSLSTLEVVAGEVGLSLAALDEVTGEDASQEVIDAIFRKFCIGK
jgi:tRNA modification GTPase